MMYRRVICVGTIWDLDNVVYPELDDCSQKKMTRWNYVQIMGQQLCSSSVDDELTTIGKRRKNVVVRFS